MALEPANWRHLFRLGHASWGDQRLRAAASTLAIYPDFAFAHFQMAMVHVARGHLSEAETVLRHGAAVQDRQLGRGGRYPALGLHWLLGLVRLAQGDIDEAIAELDREHTLAEPHRLYGREYAMHALHARGAALLRANRPDHAIDSFRCALELYPGHAPSHVGLALAFRAARSTRSADAALADAERALVTLTRTRPLEARPRARANARDSTRRRRGGGDSGSPAAGSGARVRRLDPARGTVPDPTHGFEGVYRNPRAAGGAGAVSSTAFLTVSQDALRTSRRAPPIVST